MGYVKIVRHVYARDTIVVFFCRQIALLDAGINCFVTSEQCTMSPKISSENGHGSFL